MPIAVLNIFARVQNEPSPRLTDAERLHASPKGVKIDAFTKHQETPADVNISPEIFTGNIFPLVSVREHIDSCELFVI